MFRCFLVVLCTVYTSCFSWYDLPSLNLGYTNILDGGPIRPYPGVYWQQYSIFYHSHKFLDGAGKLLGGVPSPVYNEWNVLTQLVYQFKNKLFFEGIPGFSLILPFTFYSNIKPNALGVADSGGGLGNIDVGIYSQWPAVMYKERPFFIHRLSFDVAIPWGTLTPKDLITPVDPFIYLTTSWSATLYATERLACSWRFTYVWSAKNRKTHFQPGDAILLNYSMEYPIIPNWYIAFVGYYLRQLDYNRSYDVVIPCSKERVFGLGPGSAYFFSKDLVFFTYLYGELGARNRPQGVSFVLRLVNHF